MKKYGKYIRKTRKTYRKTSRLARKVRRIRYRKRFQRRLNSIAEKKIKIVANNDAAVVPATSNGLFNDGLIKSCWPAMGTGTNERVGSQIFIRSITLEVYICNVSDAIKTNGLVGLFIAKERRGGALRSIVVNSLFDAGKPYLHWEVYKQRCVKKMWLKTRHMEFTSGELTQTPRFKYKFKIMKNASLDIISTIPNIPDIYFLPVYFDAPFSQVGATGPARYYARVTMSYTDV